MVFGTGFPPFRGGLLRYADSVGPRRLAEQLEEHAQRLGPRFQPAPLLSELARAGGRFYSDSVPQEKTA